jgi:hypothetical protein
MAIQVLVDSLGGLLSCEGFSPHWREGMARLGCVAFWRRCTLNTNRAVALLQRPEGDFVVGPYCQKMKWRLLWLTRFCPLFYEVGLQVVLCGEGLEQAMGPPGDLQHYVDRFSNQFVVLQSLFAVDTASGVYRASRTWGQVITNPVQKAIDAGIKAAGYSAIPIVEPGAAADRSRESGSTDITAPPA